MVGEFRPTETVVATKAIHLEAKIDAVKAGLLADLGAVEREPTEEINVPRKAKLVVRGRTLYERP
jgi:imidazolonepropionase-like amidohydrolase